VADTLLKGRDIISFAEWEGEEILKALELAEEMREKRFYPGFANILSQRSFLMFFFSISAQRRFSFEVSAAELGGAAFCCDMKDEGFRTPGENFIRQAGILSRYACGAGVRVLEENLSGWGEGEDILRRFSGTSDIPVFSLGHDTGDPCRGLSEVMLYRRMLGEDLEGKSILHLWVPGSAPGARGALYESIRLSLHLGMKVRVSHPEGYSPSPEIIDAARKKSGGEITLEEGFPEESQEADVVYLCPWMSGESFGSGKLDIEKEREKAASLKKWGSPLDKMKLKDKAVVIDNLSGRVFSGDSPAGDTVKEMLHAQKALMALTLSG